jgi:hypothetical protein
MSSMTTMFLANYSCPELVAVEPRVPVSANKSLQRSVNHKVLGRGRVVSALWRAPRARVLTSQPAAAELSR